MWSASIIQEIMQNLSLATLTTTNLRGKEIMLHVNQYSTLHTEPAKAFDGIFAQWTVAKKGLCTMGSKKFHDIWQRQQKEVELKLAVEGVWQQNPNWFSIPILMMPTFKWFSRILN